jgi:hypothetical protein
MKHLYHPSAQSGKKFPTLPKVFIKTVRILLLCLLAVPAQGQQQLFDLEPEHLGEWQFYYGPVTHAFTFSQKHFTTPDATEHVRLASRGEREPISGQAITSPVTESTAVVLGDGSNVNSWGAGAIWEFEVQEGGQAIVLHLFSVLQDPGHRNGQDPFVRYELRARNGRVLACGSYKVESASSGGWVPVPNSFSEKELKQATKDKKNPDERAFVFYRPWTEFLIPTGEYVGVRLVLEIMVGDCVKNGHWGMAAFDITVVQMGLEQSGSLNCDSGEGVRVTAPAGARSYAWSNGDTDRVVEVQEGGPLTVTMTTMAGCPLELSTTVEVLVEREQLGGITVSGKLTCDSKEPVELTAPENPHGYRWSTGETTRSIQVRSPGSFIVELPAAPGRSQCDQHAAMEVVADLSIPDPAFTLGSAAICEGSTVGIDAPPVPSNLRKRIAERWELGNGEQQEGPLKEAQYTVPGTIVVVRRFEFGQCIAEHAVELLVHPNPRPGLTPQVVCSPEKHFRIVASSVPPGSPTVDLRAGYCSGPRLAFEREGNTMVLPLEVDSCHEFTIHVVDNNGCMGDGALTFTPPPDPELDVAVNRVPPVAEIVFDVVDSSRHVVERVYEAEEALLMVDSLSGIARGMRYEAPGNYNFTMTVHGVPYTCPDSLSLVLRVPISLRYRFGPTHPRPVAFELTRIYRGQTCPGKPRQSQARVPSSRKDDD